MKERENQEAVTGGEQGGGNSGGPSLRPRKPPPTRDQLDRKLVESALGDLCFPYDGTDAYGRLELVSIIGRIELRRDWLTEVLEAHKKAEE